MYGCPHFIFGEVSKNLIKFGYMLIFYLFLVRCLTENETCKLKL